MRKAHTLVVIPQHHIDGTWFWTLFLIAARFPACYYFIEAAQRADGWMIPKEENSMKKTLMVILCMAVSILTCAAYGQTAVSDNEAGNKIYFAGPLFSESERE